MAGMFQSQQQCAGSGLQVHPAPAVCDKVDPLGRPANKYNLAIRSRANELRHPPPRRFISQRHIGRAGVDAAMDRRIVRTISAGDGVNHLLRLRSEEHTSELQSLMRSSYAVFCL